MRFPNDLDPTGPDLTIRELASKLEVSERTIYRWRDEGKFPSYQVGKLRISQSDVIRYIESTIK
jgi:excisionase family DNA binding protein